MAAVAQLNGALRHGILAAADSKRVQELVRRYGMRLGAARFVAGETLDECIAVLKRLNDQGLYANTTLLGEGVLAAFEPVVNAIFTRDQAVDALFYAPALNRLGEIYEAKGNKAKAREYYQRFVDQWRDAEPQFQPKVAEARRRIAALGTDAPARP